LIYTSKSLKAKDTKYSVHFVISWHLCHILSTSEHKQTATSTVQNITSTEMLPSKKATDAQLLEI